MTAQGMEFPGTIIAKHPDKQRLSISFQGMEMIQAFDGEVAWWINPFMGGTEPQKMPNEMAEMFTSQKFESDFLNYKEKGNKLTLEGKEEVEGTETYKIKLEREDGDIHYYFMDSEYFVPIMMKMAVTEGQMKGQEIETYFSDYQEIDGMMFPFYIESKVAGQSLQKMTIEEVVINEEYEDDFFAFPKEGGDKKDAKGDKKGN